MYRVRDYLETFVSGLTTCLRQDYSWGCGWKKPNCQQEMGNKQQSQQSNVLLSHPSTPTSSFRWETTSLTSSFAPDGARRRLLSLVRKRNSILEFVETTDAVVFLSKPRHCNLFIKCQFSRKAAILSHWLPRSPPSSRCTFATSFTHGYIFVLVSSSGFKTWVYFWYIKPSIYEILNKKTSDFFICNTSQIIFYWYGQQNNLITEIILLLVSMRIIYSARAPQKIC